MALKDLLVYLDETEGSLVRLRLAVDLAHRHQSHLTALYMREWNPAQLQQRKTAELAGRSLADMAQLDRAAETSIAGSEQHLQSALQLLAGRYGLQAEWRSVEGQAMTVLPQHARYADLCILNPDAPVDSTSAGYRFSEELLFLTGRPMLFIPLSDQLQTLGRHVALAWNSSRVAARAIQDALPLLQRADEVSVLAINPADFIGRHGALPQLIEHLERHGIRARSVQYDNLPSQSIGAELQARARVLGADMIVAGAYGHARLREILLGGVTRDLLTDMRMPVMMSH